VSERHGRAEVLKHVSEELRDLPAFGGLGLGVGSLGLRFAAQSRLFAFGSDGTIVGASLSTDCHNAMARPITNAAAIPPAAAMKATLFRRTSFWNR
jgi:hypothetical protein